MYCFGLLDIEHTLHIVPHIHSYTSSMTLKCHQKNIPFHYVWRFINYWKVLYEIFSNFAQSIFMTHFEIWPEKIRGDFWVYKHFKTPKNNCASDHSSSLFDLPKVWIYLKYHKVILLWSNLKRGQLSTEWYALKIIAKYNHTAPIRVFAMHI